jgi:hypothetical protein
MNIPRRRERDWWLLPAATVRRIRTSRDPLMVKMREETLAFAEELLRETPPRQMPSRVHGLRRYAEIPLWLGVASIVFDRADFRKAACRWLDILAGFRGVRSTRGSITATAFAARARRSGSGATARWCMTGATRGSTPFTGNR